MKCIPQSMGRYDSYHQHSRHSITPNPSSRQFQLVTVCCVICRLFQETSPFSCHYPLIHALYYYRFDSSAASPPLRSILTIPDDIRCILGSTLKHSSRYLRGISIIPPHTVQKHSAKTAKRPLLSPEPPTTAALNGGRSFIDE